MPDFHYFSERESEGERNYVEAISQGFWDGFSSLIGTLKENGSLAEAFPETCFESPLPIGCDSHLLSRRIQAEVPRFPWPMLSDDKPEDLLIIDAIEFFGRHVSKVEAKSYHSFGNHHHLTSFNRAQGFSEYREAINILLRRCAHPFVLQESGIVERIAPPALRQLIQMPLVTGDSDLDRMISTAIDKFHNPNLEIRKEALEKLWDAWERLKTLLDTDKARGIRLLLEESIPCEDLRGRMDSEGRELTTIGNAFMIRHTETDKIPITRGFDVDYLFHRMFALIYLLVRGRS